MKAAAIADARRGWGVVPCYPNGKLPVVKDWQHRAVADPEKVARYWPSDRHNHGVVCGASGLVVIDLDKSKEPVEMPEKWRLPGVHDGLDVFAYLLEQHGETWPSTYSVRSPRGGVHLYFAAGDHAVRNGQGRLGTLKTPLVDVRGGHNADGKPGGGFVVGVGSVVNGARYEVIDDSRPAPLPGWLAELLTKRPEPRPPARPPSHINLGKRLSGLVNLVLTAPPREGNSCLLWASCRVGELVLAGEVDEGTAERVLLDAAVQRGRPEGEARRTIESGLRRAG